MTNLSTVLKPIEEVPLLVVRSELELPAIVRRLLDDNLPGFVIQSSLLEGVDGTDHDTIANTVANVFTEEDNRLLRSLQEHYSPMHPVPIAETFGNGLLHDDDVARSDRRVVVHKTKHGAGKVTLANSGHLHHVARGTQDHMLMPRDVLDDLEAQLARGEVDTNTMSNTLHTAELGNGDIVVKRLANNKGPVFHRYDTSTPSREAEAIILAPVFGDEQAK